ncbi:MAG: hypothetical protein ABH873_03025 [Candidatus Firestonebacteria bacterium]
MLQEGTLGKNITKELVKEVKREKNPLKVLAKIRSGIPDNYFTESVSSNSCYTNSPREVILSELLVYKDK